jgi:hypothetical protein
LSGIRLEQLNVSYCVVVHSRWGIFRISLASLYFGEVCSDVELPQILPETLVVLPHILNNLMILNLFLNAQFALYVALVLLYNLFAHVTSHSEALLVLKLFHFIRFNLGHLQ